jgi:acetyltransferase-like isoleucine patch superfamily enzyme
MKRPEPSWRRWARLARTALRSPRWRPIVHPTASLEIRGGLDYRGGQVRIGPQSRLILGEGVVLAADITIGAGCRVTVGAGSRLSCVSIGVDNRGELDLGEGTIVDPPPDRPASWVIDQGRFVCQERAHLQADLLVRFDGRLTIGRYTGIGYGSEIRCEERVEIGCYGLFSYDVTIHDTNTHSTDWRARRSRIEAGYPFGTGEIAKPETRPVVIGDDVWIGQGASITKGVELGDRSVVGMGTVVPGSSYPPDSLIVAPPPRVIARTRT